MFRKNLPKNQGMIFYFKKEKPISMWMKNTYIPLDIIWLDQNYKVVHIEENTTPMSTKRLTSPIPAQYVIELIEGSCKRLGITKNTQIKTHSINTE